MPGDVLARGLPAPRNLLGRLTVMEFTSEQLVAIERRDGDLLLDAGAGSGKTSVLVERYVRVVIDDGVEVGRILAITFTDKAAAELRDRIRARLRELGDHDSALATEGAWISTIHAFCARVLRAHALAAGLDPAFTVLEEHRAAELSGAAFEEALAEFAGTPEGAELIATHGAGALRQGVLAVHDQLRAIGQRCPALPALPAASAQTPPGGPTLAATWPPKSPQGGSAIDRVRQLRELAREAAGELGSIDDPPQRIVQALDALARADELLARGVPWPGDLEPIKLRDGFGDDACNAYRAGLEELRAAAADELAVPARDALDRLLQGYADRYRARKQAESALDFDDLELLARDLLAREEIGARYRERFAHVMVDELQDTNRVQLDLVDLVAGGGALFMVGDALQSIYGFRNADVELFEERGLELERVGARASLTVNFRSGPEILSVVNAGFAEAIGDGFRPLVPAREPAAADEPLVELLVIDKGADWEEDGLAAPWRLAEARVLAHRVAGLIEAGGHSAGEIVLLTRATTDLRAYERALEDAGVPTYVIGGRGYWSHPQVVQLVGYLRALANPRDQEALYGTLLSPLCGLSLDGLVLYAAEAVDEMSVADGVALGDFQRWFDGERAAAARVGAEELIDRALAATGYDMTLLRYPDGRRRLANVRKLMRFAREWEAEAGSDLQGFVDLLGRRGGGAERESEAPVESEGLDAVRLMTIHRAKGLEFPVVCVADLGRGPRFRHRLIRVSRDGTRLGLRIGRPGSEPKIPALAYQELADQEWEAEQAEERRLFYVAMTRARERLVLSGAMRESGGKTTPADWIVPTFRDVPGVRYAWVADDSEYLSHIYRGKGTPSGVPGAEPPRFSAPPAPKTAAGVPTLSYSAIADYVRCGYRFYVERVLGLPPTSDGALDSTGGRRRGIEIHQLLQGLDFRRPVIPADIGDDIGQLLHGFATSSTCRRLAAATDVRREQRFAFPFLESLVTGTFDVLAAESDRLLVVDYKSDRLGGRSPEEIVATDYAIQQLIYAIAALRTGAAPAVEVIHLFLEAPEIPACVTYDATDLPGLEQQLEAATTPLRAGVFEVTSTPHRGVCAGCPAAGGLCSWPLELSRRRLPSPHPSAR